MLGVEIPCENYFVRGSNEEIEIPPYNLPWSIINEIKIIDCLLILSGITIASMCCEWGRSISLYLMS
jgi:hypothetical protein